MILEDATIRDLVDSVEYQMKRMAIAKEVIDKKHGVQPAGMIVFYEQIQRLRAMLDKHLEPQPMPRPTP